VVFLQELWGPSPFGGPAFKFPFENCGTVENISVALTSGRRRQRRVPDTLFHDQVEEAFDHDGVISAGFISFADGKLSCDGESESLGIKARGEDDEITIVHKMGPRR
jgi:hypothetical protein